jgi:Flp pilus assembly protein CpaB
MADPGQIASKLPAPGFGSRKLLSTRRGTITVAALAGLAAIGILLVFMSNYRNSVQSGAVDTRVLVAGTTIDKGTSGDVIGDAELFRPVTITEDEAVEGAVTDPSQIAGQVATESIYEGQQITEASFAPGADPIAGKLEGTQRALTVPVGLAEGNIGQVDVGSRVDILGGFDAEMTGGTAHPVLDVLARDVLVLRVPEEEEGSGIGSDEDKQVTVRVTDSQASRIAFAADAGDLWLTIRPPTLAKDSDTQPVQLESLLESVVNP